MSRRLNFARHSLAAIVCFAALGLAAFTFDTESSTSGLLADSRTAITDDVLALIKVGDASSALGRIADGPQKGAPPAAFGKTLADLNLATVQSVVWTKRSSSGAGEGATSELEGWATRLDGSKTQVLVKLIEQKGQWRPTQFALGKAKPPASVPLPPGAATKVPPPVEMDRLVQATVATYLEGLRERSLGMLYRQSSKKFQTKFTIESVNASFKDILSTASITGNPLAKRKPTVGVPAAIAADAILSTETYYDFGKSRFTFKIGYELDGNEWRMIAFNVRSSDAPAAAPAKNTGQPLAPVKPVAPLAVPK